MAKTCGAVEETTSHADIDLDECMTDVWHVVTNPEFKRLTRGFLEEHCDAFDLQEENSLKYTSIHHQYVEVVETALAQQLGQKRVESICLALEDFLKQHGGRAPAHIAESISVFQPLWDFEAFRVEILAVKAINMARGAQVGSSPANISGTASVDVNDALRRLQGLEAAGPEHGWQRFMESKTRVGDVLRHADSKCCLRTSVVIDLQTDEVIDMMTSLDMAAWMPHLERIEVLQECGDTEVVTRVFFKSGDSYVCRTRIEPDFPEEGAVSYVCIPWDLDQDVGFEGEAGQAKVKAGICRACGDDGTQSLLTTLDYADLGALLNADLKGAIEFRLSKIPAVVQAYREAKDIA